MDPLPLCTRMNIVLLVEYVDHILSTKQTQRGAKPGNITLQGITLATCPTCSLPMNTIHFGFHDENKYLTIHKALHYLYIDK
jgi:hypothetical protein